MDTNNHPNYDTIFKYLAFFGTGAAFVLLNSRRTNTEILEDKHAVQSTPQAMEAQVHILFATTTGTAKRFANTLSHHISQRLKLSTNIIDLSLIKDEALPKSGSLIFICSSWTGGTIPESSISFINWLKDTSYDFRVSKDYLSNAQFAIFGLGGKVYGENFGRVAFEIDECLDRLGASRMVSTTVGDDGSDLEQQFYKWSSRIVKALAVQHNLEVEANTSNSKDKKQKKNSDSTTCCNTNANSNTNDDEQCCSKPPEENDDDIEDEDEINDKFIDSHSDEDMVDVEEIGSTYARASAAAKTDETSNRQPREMVTKLQRKALTKEGYKIIGSHSAVKLCRWTKNQLRGRGGCYKHSFYGITSYQCMEATPSLACANKCVFCWRHHKNPVGTEWRWKTDEPDHIVEEAVRLHVGMINEFKGVPGVQADRLQEARTVKHCALSLVGEPIMYPRINEMIRELHSRGISSFLVTNAQFPDKIEELQPVTQLYVSVDAATKESLKAVDRPLFKDFWERYQACLHHLSKKLQRTVYRMTLVKSWNMSELEGYAQLIEAGIPDFIEIKAVTYCGKSDASSLTMENVPWHKDVCQYGDEICRRLRERGLLNVNYSIATEHEHSCCILIAREDKFKLQDGWHTWIDYDRFQQLIQEYYDSNGAKTFRSEDYRAKTPEWALYRSKEKGFDPDEKRWHRSTQKKEV